MTRDYILTGAPGAGKTSILRQLQAEGLDVVEEAATDVIALEQGRGVAEPWTQPAFIESVARLQLQRMAQPPAGMARVMDRSLICTLALAEYLGHPVPETLTRAIGEAIDGGRFERRVMLVESLGFITPTEARRISLAESQRFERFHVDAYERLGFELVRIPAMAVVERTALVRSLIDA